MFVYHQKQNRTNVLKALHSISMFLFLIIRLVWLQIMVMVFNTTFNNISIISWRSILLVEETAVPAENTDLPQVTDKLQHIKLYGIRNHNVSGIDTDWTGSCKQARIQGAHSAPLTLKMEKNMIFILKIVIFHTKYPKNLRPSIRSARFFLRPPPPPSPNLKSWIRTWKILLVYKHDHNDPC